MVNTAMRRPEPRIGAVSGALICGGLGLFNCVRIRNRRQTATTAASSATTAAASATATATTSAATAGAETNTAATTTGAEG